MMFQKSAPPATRARLAWLLSAELPAVLLLLSFNVGLVATARDGLWREQIPRSCMNCAAVRSEEHTSELQSPDHLVCRLLLEKKKKESPNSHVALPRVQVALAYAQRA